MMITDSIGLYLHIPFCLKKCNYCDFSSYSSVGNEVRNLYIKKLTEEIKSYKSSNRRIDTVFFGGGTPSLLTPSEISEIGEAIHSSFSLADDIEISLEANPGALSLDSLSEFVRLGVNRVSIGLQSANDNELKILGRIHNFDDFVRTFNEVRKVGINNINVDIMYGIPEQTLKSFDYTLKTVSSISPEHLSVYGLILEEGTPFYKSKDSLCLPCEDDEVLMYNNACSMLLERGYLHYEISNYAKPSYQSRHNLKYWRNEEYIGVGLAAHSRLGNKRFFNPSAFDEYFSLSLGEYITEEVLDLDADAYEYAMMRLRLSEGILLSDYEARFGRSFFEGKENEISFLAEKGFLKIQNGRLFLTEKGFYVSNTILSQLL